jgi:hypothetical protein
MGREFVLRTMVFFMIVRTTMCNSSLIQLHLPGS